MIHLLLHFVVPLAIAIGIYRGNWFWPFAIMMTSMAIDLDHLLADPIYDPTRCSVGFHPLHTIFPIIAYTVLLIFKKTRLLGVGLCIHIGLDSVDCRLNTGLWYVERATTQALTYLA